MIVTIDGPVAAGKTSAATMLAKRLDFTLLDTGAIYRSVALVAQRNHRDWSDEPRIVDLARHLRIDFRVEDGLDRVLIDGVDATEEIRQPEISRGASLVSALPGVRHALLALQRRQAAQGDVIAEGRDTGTVVFPNADRKFYLDAEIQIRAQRRFAELQEKGVTSSFETVFAELEERDHRDSNRAIAPLVAASDAVYVDSSTLNLAEVVARLHEEISRS